MYNKNSTWLILIMIPCMVLGNPSCLGGKNDKPKFNEQQIIELGNKILQVSLSLDNVYETPTSAFHPDIYELYSMNKLTGEFFSNDLWIDIGRYYAENSTSAMWSTHFFIFILPRNNEGEFYLITGWEKDYRDEDYYELRKYPSTQILSVRKKIFNGDQLNDIDFLLVAKYYIDLKPQTEVTTEVIN